MCDILSSLIYFILLQSTIFNSWYNSFFFFMLLLVLLLVLLLSLFTFLIWNRTNFLIFLIFSFAIVPCRTIIIDFGFSRFSSHICCLFFVVYLIIFGLRPRCSWFCIYRQRKEKGKNVFKRKAEKKEKKGQKCIFERKPNQPKYSQRMLLFLNDKMLACLNDA